VYTRKAQPQRRISTFGLYILLFPQLIAGPIIRFRDIAGQLDAHPGRLADFAYGVRRFTLGLGSGERLNEHVIGGGWPGIRERHERLSEAIDIIKGLLAGDLQHYQGTYFKLDHARVFDRPEQPPSLAIAAGALTIVGGPGSMWSWDGGAGTISGGGIPSISFTGVTALTAGGANDTLTGPAADSTWHVTGAGAGTVASAPAGIDCGSVCSRTFGAGAVVTLSATPAAGSVFTGWSGGGCSGAAPCTVTVAGATSVSATVSYSGATATLTPKSPLAISTVPLIWAAGVAITSSAS